MALIGTGAWSGAVGKATVKSREVKLVTCFDPAHEKVKAFSEKFGCELEKSYEEVLDRKDINGVHIISPNAVHAEQTELAAQNGKHVFVQKPIANTMVDGKRMIEACQESGVVLMVGHHLRQVAWSRKAYVEGTGVVVGTSRPDDGESENQRGLLQV